MLARRARFGRGDLGGGVLRGVREADPRRAAARDDRAGAPAHPEDDRAGGVLVRRDLVDGVRDRGDPLRHRGRRRRASRSASTSSCRSRSRSRSCSRSSSTSYRQTIFAYPSGGGSLRRQPREPRRERRRSSRARRCSSTTSSPSRCRSRPASPRSSRSPRSTDLRRPPGRCSALVLIVFITPREPARASRSRAGSSRSRPTSTSSIAHRARRATGCSAAFVLGDIEPMPFDPERVRGRASRRAARSACSCILKGFSSGAVALTGVEAISNGVPAFRRPESKNAATTLVWMAIDPRHAVPRRVGPRPPPRTRTRATTRRCSRRWARRCSATAPCSTWSCSSRPRRSSSLAANTAYADFPRLSSIIARDGYLPAPAREPRRPARVLERRRSSSRVAAGVLIVAFGGITNALIPLYAVGVFTSFTLSQIGHGAPPPDASASSGWKRSVVDQRRRRGRDVRRAR